MPPPPANIDTNLTNKKKQNLSNVSNLKTQEIALHELPPPPFTIKELRDAVPHHCFQRSLFRSSLYLINDLVIISGKIFLKFLIIYPLSSFLLSLFL